MKKNTSKKIYKYYAINQNLFSSIITNEFYFSNPRNFNDPFDSNPRFNISSNIQHLERFFEFLQKEVNKKSKRITDANSFQDRHSDFKFLIETMISIKSFANYDVDLSEHEERLVEIFTFYNNKKYFKEVYNIDQIILQRKMFDDYIFLCIDTENYGIWSASKTSTCPVLWGHYADNHRGVCLEFELFTEEEKPNINFPENKPFKIVDVNYTDQPIDVFSMDNETLVKLSDTIINTKYNKWEYEKEIRLINSNRGLTKFNRNALTSIIFGQRSSPRDRYALCKLLGSLRYEASFLMARIQPDNYEMKIQPMVMHDIVGSGVHLSEIPRAEKFRS